MPRQMLQLQFGSPVQGVPMLGTRQAGCAVRLVALLAALAAFANAELDADVAWRESFDAPQLSWKLQATADARLVSQERRQLRQDATLIHYESVSVLAPAGYSAHVAHDIPRAPLIDELKIELRVRSPQPGLQVGVEIVCPRTREDGNSQPARLLVVGSRYAQSGTWQTLVADQLPLAAKRQTRFQKTPAGESYDLQEAYIDRVVAIVPGGPQPTLVDFDEIVVHGVVFSENESVRRVNHTVDPSEAPILEGPLVESVLAPPKAPEIRPVEVSRRGNVIAVSGAPFVPRIARYRGEAMTTLAEMGFNTVWLDHVPTTQELSAAYQARLWIIAPPPASHVLESLPAESTWQTILAWSLGRYRSALDIDATRSLADSTRLADSHLKRPLAINAYDRRRTFSQLADILVDPLHPWSNDRLPSNDNSVRLLGCAQWALVETQISDSALAQALAFAPHQSELAYRPPLTVRQAAIEALAGGARGVVFETGDSLAGKHAAVRSLAVQLELLHREIALLEPWLVAGKEVAGARVDRRDELPCQSWQLERARLVLIPPHAPLPGPNTGVETVTVAGIPETATAHLVTTAGLVPLEVQRVTGGLRVTAGDLTGGALLLLTDDQRALTQLKEHTSSHSERSAKGERDLAKEELVALDAALHQTKSQQAGQPDPLAQSKSILRQCDLLLASRDYPRALQLARTLRFAMHRYVETPPPPTASTSFGHESWPIPAAPATWATAVGLRHAAGSLRRGPNILPAGDFEQLDQARSSGWMHRHYDSQAWATAVELVGDSPRHGQSALRLRASSVPGQLSDVAPWQPLVWVSSPEIPVPQGATVEITGWARLDGSEGRLIISDTLGGEELALRIEATSGWESFRAIRSVGPVGKVGIRLALVGAGEADIDAVMIRQILPPSQPAPTTATAPGLERGNRDSRIQRK